MHSEIVLPASEPVGLDYALSDLPNGIAAITHELLQHRGRAVAEEFLVRVLASAAVSAIVVLGKEQAIEMLALQAAAAEQFDADD